MYFYLEPRTAKGETPRVVICSETFLWPYSFYFIFYVVICLYHEYFSLIYIYLVSIGFFT